MIQPETDLLVAPEARPALARSRRRALKRSGIVLSLLVCVCVAMIYALARAGVPIRDGALAWLRSSRADAASTVAVHAALPALPAIERPALPATIEPTRKRVAAPAVASNAPVGGRASSREGSDEEHDVVPPPPTVDPDPEVPEVVPIANLLGSLTPDELSFVTDVVGRLEGPAGGLVGDGAVGETLADVDGLAGGVLSDPGGVLSDPGGIAGDALAGAGAGVGGVLSGAGGGVGGVISDPGGTVGGVVGGLLE